MSEISIVGGGITGLAAARLANKSVNIFEASKNLGGILRDLNSGEHSFFSSCQYLNGRSSWLHRMGWDKNLYEFDHIYASYTDLFGKKTISDSFAGPVYKGSDLNFGDSEVFCGISLADRCDVYPLEISSALKNWFRYIGVDVNITHGSAITGFQASRIYVSGQEEKITELKKKNSLADSIYGLPRNVIGLSSIKSFLPVKGFNNLFDNFVSRNIKLEKNLTVNCEILNNRLFLKTKSGVFEPDQIIWTADPTKLVCKAFGEKLDSQKFSAEVLVGYLDSSVDSPFYIQVFSSESRVQRIYLYNIEGRGCFTIEKAFDDQITCDVIEFCQTVVANFSNKKIKNVVIRKRNNRYFAYTIKDHKTLSRLHSQEHITNLITPDYLSYGRDQKIDSIMSQLHEF